MGIEEILGLSVPVQEGDSTRAVALTIAGSDSGGGAGIQADLKTFAALGVHGSSVLTLVTAQNTRGVSGLTMLDEAIVRAQYEAVSTDLEPAAAKTGALGSAAMIHVVAEMLRERPIDRLVVDPVMVSKHGDPLLPEDAQRAHANLIAPLALLITPNRFEAERLIERDVGDVASMKEAAKRIFDLGARHVLIKGSHVSGPIVRDIFFDGRDFTEFGADRIDSKRLHGSGCAYSAAICAHLARDVALDEAIGQAREFISEAIARAPRIGHGISPVDPMHAHRP